MWYMIIIVALSGYSTAKFIGKRPTFREDETLWFGAAIIAFPSLFAVVTFVFFETSLLLEGVNIMDYWWLMWFIVGWLALARAARCGDEVSFRELRNDWPFAAFMVAVAAPFGPAGFLAFRKYKDR